MLQYVIVVFAFHLVTVLALTVCAVTVFALAIWVITLVIHINGTPVLFSLALNRLVLLLYH